MSFLDTILGKGGDDNADTNNDLNNNNSNQNQNDLQNNSNNSDNNADNVDNNKPFWDNSNKNDESSNNAESQTVKVIQQPTPKTADEQMQDHVKGLNLTAGIDSAQIAEDLREGKTESFDSAMQTISANAYQASMTDMNRIMDAKMTKFSEDATANANASMNSNMAVAEMQKTLPFTTDKDIAPVAKAILTQALKNSDSTEKAIEGVKAFFDKMGASSRPPNSDTGNPQFPGSEQDNNSGQTSHDDWLGVLTGKT